MHYWTGVHPRWQINFSFQAEGYNRFPLGYELSKFFCLEEESRVFLLELGSHLSDYTLS
jgi:hypothetical protein